MAKYSDPALKSKDLRPLVNLLPYLKFYRWQIAYALIALVVASASTLVVPVAVRRILDQGFNAANIELINTYFLGMIGVVVVLAASSAIRFYYVSWIGERVVADVRDALFGHLLTLTPQFYETQKTGNVVSRLTADTTQIKSAFSSTASIALRNVVTLIGALALMIYTSPYMSMLAAVAIPFVVLPLVFYGRKVRALSRKAQDALAQSAAFSQERLQGVFKIHRRGIRSSTGPRFCSCHTHLLDDRDRHRCYCCAAMVWCPSSSQWHCDWWYSCPIFALCDFCIQLVGAAFRGVG
jgi:ATP-binding cassette, subfamily B, bacterial